MLLYDQIIKNCYRQKTHVTPICKHKIEQELAIKISNRQKSVYNFNILVLKSKLNFIKENKVLI